MDFPQMYKTTEWYWCVRMSEMKTYRCDFWSLWKRWICKKIHHFIQLSTELYLLIHVHNLNCKLWKMQRRISNGYIWVANEYAHFQKTERFFFSLNDFHWQCPSAWPAKWFKLGILFPLNGFYQNCSIWNWMVVLLLWLNFSSYYIHWFYLTCANELLRSQLSTVIWSKRFFLNHRHTINSKKCWKIKMEYRSMGHLSIFKMCSMTFINAKT